MSQHECIGECDCCGRGDRHLRQMWVYGGMETWACAECRGEDPDADLDDKADAESLEASLRSGP